ncbi:MAG: branched-chain amino acid transaminase [Acidobacteria bacterium]|nr:branched-chain amino acid transaminase [Acidobacteriota bacterium]
MFSDAKWVWMDGKMVPWQDATVHVSSHALHYGTGVFEGIRCYLAVDGPAIFRLDAHLDRLFNSADAYSIKIAYTKEELADVICEVIRKNGFESCYIRPICYYGSAVLGLVANRCPLRTAVLAWPWAAMHGNQSLEQGVRMTVSRWVKFHSGMMPTTAKACGQYVNSVLAAQEAVKKGYDDALLLDDDGYVTEATGENIFVVKKGHVITNDAEHSILMGVTRDSAITIARDLGYPVEIRAIEMQDVLSADEVFMTGTAAEVTPVRSIDEHTAGSGRRGPITAEIQRVFFDAVYGRDARYRRWLHFVNAPANKAVAPAVS